nr:transcriptional regulator EFH1 isoform X2 [Ipomoea batatas]
MESNGMYSNMGSGMLGLEMSLHHVPPQQNPMQHQSHPRMVSYVDHRQQSQPPLRPAAGGTYPSGNKPKTTPGLTLSDDDDPGGPTADQNSADDGKRKTCPWQRMKWTDNMVRLLIMVVYYIGDEVGSEGNSNDPAAGNKKKAGAAGGGGVLQKKGKWKSVSRAMMERGFYVSPQQCEDKFNDLNKRYKRVNDIIGKGTACKVVENQTLLETLDLSPKMKEEAKKLLNSKHLFFREMCAYHNSCAHGGASGSAAADGGSDPTSQTNNHHQKCMHSSENVRIGPNLGRADVEEPKDDNDEDDEDSDDDEDEESEEDEEEEKSRKRARKTESWSPLLEQMSGELTNVCEDSTRSPGEKRRWIKARTMQLEEQRVEFQSQALELEKQRLKWEKFSSKKEREMEREKMMNQRKKLENDRMVLLLHQKELELNDVHHQGYNRTSDPSSVTG